MAENVSYTAPDPNARFIRFEESEDGVRYVCCGVRRVGNDGSSDVRHIYCMLQAGTPPEQWLPLSTLIGMGKPFANVSEATAFRDKLVEIYQALRTARNLDP